MSMAKDAEVNDAIEGLPLSYIRSPLSVGGEIIVEDASMLSKLVELEGECTLTESRSS